VKDKPIDPPSGAPEDRFTPADVEVRREDGVTITFLDGMAVDFNLMELRLACPCATCRSMRDKAQASWPTPSSPQPLRISDAELHGGWGLRLVWNDGHGTGIYPFDSLRAWADEHEDRFAAERTAEQADPPSVI